MDWPALRQRGTWSAPLRLPVIARCPEYPRAKPLIRSCIGPAPKLPRHWLPTVKPGRDGVPARSSAPACWRLLPARSLGILSASGALFPVSSSIRKAAKQSRGQRQFATVRSPPRPPAICRKCRPALLLPPSRRCHLLRPRRRRLLLTTRHLQPPQVKCWPICCNARSRRNRPARICQRSFMPARQCASACRRSRVPSAPIGSSTHAKLLTDSPTAGKLASRKSRPARSASRTEPRPPRCPPEARGATKRHASRIAAAPLPSTNLDRA